MPFVLILFCLLPVQAYAHFVCLESGDTSAFSSGDPARFRVYLHPNGQVSIAQVSNGERSWTLAGAWEEPERGRLDLSLRDTEDKIWKASGKRDAVFNISGFVRLKLDFRSKTGRSFAIICSSTELY